MNRLDSQSAERLTKLLGMLGSNSDGERATAGRIADQFVRDLGLTWSDIVVPEGTHLGSNTNWRRMADYCYALRGTLYGKSREFVENIHGRRRDLTPKQIDWLKSIYDRLRRGKQQ
jgi:hypothetical protein